MITKQIAGILYGNSYRLYEVATNKVWDIQGIIDNSVLVCDDSEWTIWINFDKIDTDFLIIARPLSDLTKDETFDMQLDLYLWSNLPEGSWIDINQIKES